MSIRTAIYKTLAADPDLAALLARSSINPSAPAIYEQWAPPETAMPYLNLTFTEAEGNHWGKRNGKLFIDIFTKQDSTNAEAIRNRILKIIDREFVELEGATRARVHSDSDSLVQEPTPEVTHWEMEFSVYYWRQLWIQ